MTRDEVARTVVATITEILPDVPAARVRPELSLRDLGADSVDRVEIITLLVHRMRRTDELSAFAAIPDVGALIDYLSPIDHLSPEETR